MKKRTIIIISAVSVLAVAGAGFGIYKLIKNNASPVEVVSVSSLNTGWWGESMPTSGIITADATQTVHLDSDDLVDEVYVNEGDKVKIGDKLLSYDTTLLELDYESARLERQGLKLQIKSANQELEKLKKTTPVSDSYYSSKEPVWSSNIVSMTAAEPFSETSQTETIAETDGTEVTSSEESTETEPETTAETTEETEESPLGKIKAYGTLKYDSEPYKGTGTKEDPYVFFCKDGTTINASFMNKMLGFNESGTSKKKGGMGKDGKGSYAILEIREGDSVQGGYVKSISINGTVKADKAYAPDITWTLTSEGVTKNVPEVDEPDDDEPDDDDFFDDDFGGDFGDDVYTVTELKEAIQEKEDEIKDLKLDLKEAKLTVAQAKRKVDEATVKATINGVVKSVGDPLVGEIDGEGFLTVTSNEGLYVKGSISELKLGKVQVGSIMTGNSYESGSSFTAEITEISEYPDTSDNYGYYSGNSNASQYPFLAYIAESDGLSTNEYVDLTIQDESGMESSSIYLYKAYVRSENGQSYVYKADENQRLTKQYIKTGATLYGSTIEVKSGLTNEDQIAFPYGKNVVEGARVKTSDDDTMDMGIMY